MRIKALVAGLAALCLWLAAVAVLASIAVGWSFDDALNSFVVSNLVIGVSFGLCGALISWHRPRHPVGWLYLVGGLLQTLPAAAAPLAQLTHDHHGSTWLMRLLVTVFAWAWPIDVSIAIPLSLFLLPDGRLPSGRWRPVFILVALSAPLFVVETGTAPQLLDGIPDGFWVLPQTGGWAVLWQVSEVRFLLSVLIGIAAMTVRYRHGSEVIRRQLLWILLSAATVLVAVTPWSVVAGTPILVLFAIPLLPLGITVAILRYGLLDVRIVLARGLTYALLSGLVLAAYTALVLVLSGVASALLVALVILPLRARVQRAVERLLYGQRNDPVRVTELVGPKLSDLSGSLDVVRDALRFPYVAVVIDGEVLGAAGDASDQTVELSISADAQLRIGLRRGEGSLGAADARVLGLLSGPLALAVAATITSRDLQRSREHLVSAREEERRRLRRDLHDGLGPLLTGVALAADAASNVGSVAPEEARVLLSGVRADTRTAIAEVRRIVDDLRPSALDDLGLVAALQLRAGQTVHGANGRPLRATVEATAIDGLPAAVEVAAYRIATEALTNVVRHSAADTVIIRITATPGVLCLEVVDDGPGRDAWTADVGLASMRARAEELGGDCLAGPTEHGGSVRAHIPLAAQ